jgi:hypothetical protein
MNAAETIAPSFENWAIVELMGHVRMTGMVREVERFGSKVGEINVVDKNGEFVATQMFGGAGLYRMTLCDKQTAMELAVRPQLDSSVDWSLRAQIRKEVEQGIQEPQRLLEGKSEDDEEEQEW